jgi:hypothetical protein
MSASAAGAVASTVPEVLSPPPDEPDSLQAQLVETLTRPTSISSYGGWAAWSSYDPTHRGYQLVVRSPRGEVTVLGIAESSHPFEVSLGPLAAGGVGAVYPRCDQGCQLEELPIESPGAPETPLAVPGGGSLQLPALWKNTISFLRAMPNGGESHPVEMFEWTLGSKHLKALALPRNSLSPAQLRAQPELRITQGYVGEITALALEGTQVAYTRVAPWGEWDRSDLWVQRPGKQPQLIDRIDTGGGAMFGTRTYLTPTIAGPWLYAYRQYHEAGPWDGDPAWVRYSLTTNTAQQAEVSFGNREGFEEDEGPLDAVAPLGAGAIWTLQLPTASARCAHTVAGERHMEADEAAAPSVGRARQSSRQISNMQEAGRERNPNIGLDALVETLLNPVLRKARQRALAADSQPNSRPEAAAANGPTR